MTKEIKVDTHKGMIIPLKSNSRAVYVYSQIYDKIKI
jgi:hypothetical protein